MKSIAEAPEGIVRSDVIFCEQPYISEVGGGNGAERRPPPGIQAQHPAPAPHASHARHDRSMARNRLAARAKVGRFSSSPRASRKYAPRQLRTSRFISFILARNYNGFLQDMFCPEASPLIKKGFREFHSRVTCNNVDFSKELQWLSCGHVFGMFESPYKTRVW